MSIQSQPLIAVPADSLFFDGYVWHASPAQYLKAACDVANVTPLIVPAFGDDLDLDAILDAVDGVLITGAKSNVEPHHYGKEATKDHGPFDPERDATSLKLIKKTIERNVPLLAICRGHQELNVALGGSLTHAVHEISGRIDHRAPDVENMDEKFSLRQNVNIREKSTLAAIIGSGKITVNSLHRQAIDEISEKLIIEAVADDGTIEAVSVEGAKNFALGVQWHPEYFAHSDKPSQNIFKAFGQAVLEHKKHRTQI